MTNNEYGFSLFELLIVLTIIGILSAIAYPVYRHAINKTRRTEAKIALIKLANRMEIYYLENNNSYANANLADLGVNFNTDKGFYRLSLSSTNNTYQLSAIANFNDPYCYKLKLNELGENSSEPEGTCW
ncbi:MAG: type IV pilin protein [Rickettsiella sp.]|nr:type IV pilin protein [Rickettsiella sp.]